jgi:hypothetical protein
MKPINLQTLLLPVIGWVLDFQADNNRLPDSLDDLLKNKSKKRDYNPARILKQNREDGFNVCYTLKQNNVFELKIEKDNSFLLYNSLSKSASYYQDNETKYEITLSDSRPPCP